MHSGFAFCFLFYLPAFLPKNLKQDINIDPFVPLEEILNCGPKCKGIPFTSSP